MQYIGMPLGMWFLFKKSFQDHLVSVLGFSAEEAKAVAAAAKPKYREIIGKLPEFEKADRFKMNIVNCALFSAFILSMKALRPFLLLAPPILKFARTLLTITVFFPARLILKIKS